MDELVAIDTLPVLDIPVYTGYVVDEAYSVVAL